MLFDVEALLSAVDKFLDESGYSLKLYQALKAVQSYLEQALAQMLNKINNCVSKPCVIY